MQCVSCGKEITLDQKFCRFCGTSLKTDAGVTLSHRGDSESVMPLAKATTPSVTERTTELLERKQPHSKPKSHGDAEGEV